MNKQELIGILEGLEGDSFIEKYNEGYDQAVRACLIAVKQARTEKSCCSEVCCEFYRRRQTLR